MGTGMIRRYLILLWFIGIIFSLITHSKSRTLLRAAARDGLAPHECLKQVNHLLLQDNDSNMFVTVWYGIINLDTGDLEYSNGGHPEPLVIMGNHVRKLLRVEGAARVYSRR